MGNKKLITIVKILSKNQFIATQADVEHWRNLFDNYETNEDTIKDACANDEISINTREATDIEILNPSTPLLCITTDVEMVTQWYNMMLDDTYRMIYHGAYPINYFRIPLNITVGE